MLDLLTIRKMLKHKYNKGFTLVELLIAISLIAILSGVLLSVLNPIGIQKKARDSQRVSDLSKIKVALENYFADNRKYPNTAPVTANTWVKTSALSTFLENGKYINKLPTDPKPTVTANCAVNGWREYYYKTNANGTVYILSANLEIAPSTASTCPYTSPDCSGCVTTGVNAYYTTID